MARNRTKPQGAKPDKVARDALALELRREIEVTDPDTRERVKVAKMRLVQRALVNKAIKGDVPAIKEINDRMDGRVPTTIRGEGEGGAIPIQNIPLRNLTSEQLERLKESILATLEREEPEDPPSD